MKSILYVGNRLFSSNTNITAIHTLGSLLESEHYKVIYTSGKTNKFLRLCDMLFTLLKVRKNVSCVLIDTYSTQNFYFALFISQLARVCKLKYIPILRGGNLSLRLKQNPRFSNLIFNNAQINVSPSLFLKKEFEAFGYQNVTHIPNTIKINEYPFQTKTFDTPRLLWVRSFSKIYNPELAIHVLHRLKKTYPKATLCMVGPNADGTLSQVKQLASDLNLEVDFTGKLKKQEWISVSKAYNIFINTTNFDNTPVSVIEAMALGLPIISTNVGGMPYLIKNRVDGLLVEPDDTELMVEAIISVMENPKKRQDMIHEARQKVETFDWSQIKPLWFKVLPNITSNS
ncbi:glycosyltransferase family 4 protein [uncultured Psychroserpens sp.]|uniref:glycosyltransferase family 4 protein n=1 Tax=uncultured Psychroserpens sp. TaxID=255436 RepID=UPI002608332D|nr:glycosyltransferase family 4 protein [uncultured Psychroserpens sp.]